MRIKWIKMSKVFRPILTHFKRSVHYLMKILMKWNVWNTWCVITLVIFNRNIWLRALIIVHTLCNTVQRSKHFIAFHTIIPLLGTFASDILQGKINSYMYSNCNIIANKIWKEAKCLFLVEWLSNLWYIYSMKWYQLKSVMKNICTVKNHA